MRSILCAASAIAAFSHPLAADDAHLQFCWIGANGYTMEGEIFFPEELLGTGVITQAEVTGFQIIGYLDGIAVGSWNLEKITPQTSWTLRFDTDSLRFPTGGHRDLGTYQEWNANGSVNDCGAVDGFGFNGGNYAQDVCINNTWIRDSSIDPDTPIFAQPAGQELVCDAALPVS